MAKREFLMLAHVFSAHKHGVAGWMLSEKLDGMRCFWDGGVSRGLPKVEVPWANVDKDERYLTQPIATGLWSRYGNVIHAPDWWLDALPPIMLDGELFTVRGDRQRLMSTVKDLVPGIGWDDVRFFVFDSPPPEVIFANGDITGVNYNKVMDGSESWFQSRAQLRWQASSASVFGSIYKRLCRELADCDEKIVRVLRQIELPYGVGALDAMYASLDVFVERGGEGVILRDPHSWWIPERAKTMLKVKKYLDAEARVIGYTTGRQTDKGSKLLGLMGALVVEYDGKRLELSGFTDEERTLDWTPGECRAELECSPVEWAIENPGQEVPDWIQAAHYPRGSVITFTFRDLSRDGIPQEARYQRKRG